MKITVRSFKPAIVWFILSTIAFSLPGSTLPVNYWFDIIHLDKWIHVGIFSVLVFLWCLPLLHRSALKQFKPNVVVGISMVIFGYGVIMEFVQHFFISNRSFDLGDIAADAIGCLTGLIFVKNQWKQ